MSEISKKYRVQIQNAAIEELDRIYAFIFEGSPANAKRFVRSLRKKIESLQDFPRRGYSVNLSEHAFLGPEIRFIEYKGYLILYAIDKSDVIVLHVTGPGQDWMRFFLK